MTAVPEVVRRVHRIIDPVGRDQLLELLGLQAYCEKLNKRCLIWLNEDIVPMSQQVLHVHHGDYIRIALPPGPEALDHIATRCIATAYYQGMNQNDILDRHTLYRLGWFEQAVSQPFVPVVPHGQEEATLLQLQGALLPPLEDTPPFLQGRDGERHVHGQKGQYPCIWSPVERLEEELPHRIERRSFQDLTQEEFLAVLQNQPAAIQELFYVWLQIMTTAQEPEQTTLQVQTWFIDHPRYWVCREPRTIHIDRDFTQWLRLVYEEWRDRIDPSYPVHIHLAIPSPQATAIRQTVQPQVIVMQHEPLHQVANLYTIMDYTSQGAVHHQFATFAPNIVDKRLLAQAAEVERRCFSSTERVHCMIWHGDLQIDEAVQVRNRHGLAYLIIMHTIQHGGQSVGATAWEQVDEEAMIQLTRSVNGPSQRIRLSLDTLIPPSTVAVQLIDGIGGKNLPTPLEVQQPGSAAQVETELRAWGHQCAVYECPGTSHFLCLEAGIVADEATYHYIFCHDDVNDPQGIFLHSDVNRLTETQVMAMLCQLGYARAVILQQADIAEHWIYVQFHHREPQMQRNPQPVRCPSKWPDRAAHCRKSQALIELDNVKKLDSTCQLQTCFDVGDLHELFQSGAGILCDDLERLDLPTEIKEKIAKCPVVPLRSVKDLDQYDRLCIFTDGSSRPSMRRFTPEQADDRGSPDTWAFLVVGEIFHAQTQSTLHILGWTAQPVRYDPLGEAFSGATRIGSDIAERSALISACMWRLSWNHTIPTLFCSDSTLAGGQASGKLGNNTMDLTYQLLRSLFQALEIALPVGDVGVHHVIAHAGDCFNELVDVAAKMEMKKSFNLPRRRLCMQEWIPKFLQLWTLFGDKVGLPQWCDGGFNAPAPEIPASQSVDPSVHRPPWQNGEIQFSISMASANVQSLYRSPDGHAGKLHYLQEQMRMYKLNYMAIQEARSEAGMFMNGKLIRLCTGHRQHQYGLELWINCDVPFAKDHKGRAHHFQASHFQIAYYDPRRLLVRCDAGIWSCWLLVLHAPHSGHPLHEQRAWWTQLREILEEHYDQDTLFILADANASPGHKDGSIVIEKDFAPTANTADWCDLLRAYDLCLPATSNIHVGSTSTWTHCTGLTEHCIDHVAIPRQWLDRCTHSEVLEHFDLATVNADHKAIALQLQWWDYGVCHPAGEGRGHRRKAALYVHDDGASEQFAHIAHTPWEVDVEQQTLHITDQLHKVLAANQKPQVQRAKQCYLTPEVWEMRKQKLEAKRALQAEHRHQKQSLLRTIWQRWTRSTQTLPEDNAIDYFLQHQAHSRHVKLVASYRNRGKRLRKLLSQCKKQELCKQVHNLPENASAAEVLRQLRSFTGPTNPKKRKQKALPCVQDDQGNRCSLPSTALQTWIKFFQEMEAGKRMSRHELREIWIQELQQYQQDEFQIALAELPTLTDLERALRRVPQGRASGPDGLPGELCRHQPITIAKLLYPILIKTMLHGHEPLEFKGGQLTPVYQGRGPMDLCKSYRSLLVSNHLGKAIHRTIRQHYAPIYEAYLQAQQTGGRRGAPVQLPMHQVRAFTRDAKQHNRSTGILYLDLVEAFYRVVREMPMGGEMSDELVGHIMAKLHMPADALHDLHRLLQEPSALQSAGLAPWSQRCIRAVHQSTHFWLQNQEDITRTAMGSRPGDSFADVIFGYMWATILKKLEIFLKDNQLIQPLPAHEQLPLYGHNFALDEQAYFIGPTWMDDLAVCFSTTSAEELVPTASHVCSHLLDLCEFHCVTPNLSRGKTELQLTFRGLRSRSLKVQHYGPNAPGEIPILCERGTHMIQLVTQYKHLGGIVHHSSDQRAELRQRAAIAHGTMSQFGKMLFRNKDIQFGKRAELFQMLVMTKFLYGAESWVASDDRTQKAYHSTVV